MLLKDNAMNTEALPPDFPKLVDEATAAAAIGVSPSHLKKVRLYEPDSAVPHLHIGRRVLYPLNGPNGLGAWVEERMRTAGAAR